MSSITIVGKGNVATHFYKAMKGKGFEVKIISSRNTFDKKDFTSDIIILAVKDMVIKEVMARISQDLEGRLSDRQILVHTSGFMETSFLQSLCDNYGSFYPLQSLKKNIDADFSCVTLCTWANTTWASQILEKTALTLSPLHYFFTDEQRKKIHLAAVFANNFTNHLFYISSNILKDVDLNLDVLYPLIDRTIKAIKEKDPKYCQTGPAIREDYNIIKEHLSLLPPSIQEIYRLLTQSIINTKHNETE